MNTTARLVAAALIVNSIAGLVCYYAVGRWRACRARRAAAAAAEERLRQAIAQRRLQERTRMAFEQTIHGQWDARVAEAKQFEREALAEIEQLTGGQS